MESKEKLKAGEMADLEAELKSQHDARKNFENKVK